MKLISFNQYKNTKPKGKLNRKKVAIIITIVVVIIILAILTSIYMLNKTFRDNVDRYIFRKNIEENKIVCKILDEVKSLAESNLNITIFQGLPKSDKMELIIQKATELGVKTIVPVITKRTVIKLKDKDKQNKVDRWRKIAEVAAKQSGRDIIPTIENIINIADIKFDEFDKIFVLYENEEKISIKDEIEQLKNDNKEELNIGIVIGPEGGFAESEIEQLRLNQNVSVVTLGKRILRTETVALVVSGILMYELGDLN